MAKFILTPAIFEADYSTDFGGVADSFISLQTDGNKYNGFFYQENSQFAFFVGSQTVKLWAEDVEEIKLGNDTYYRDNGFTNNEELFDLVKAYNTVLMGLS